MKNCVLLAALVATSLFREKPSMADAFPSGAGGCMGGVAAVEELHLDSSNGRPVVGGTLADGAIRITVGDVLLDVNTVNEIPVGQDLLVGVEADDISFLGVLVRLQAPAGVDTTGALIPGANVGQASACLPPVVGITHMNDDQKTMATGTLRFDEEIDGITLDVTIVFLNAPEGSAYVYSGFEIQTRALGSASPADNASPTVAPSPLSEVPSSEVPSSDVPSSVNNSGEPTSFTQAPVSSAPNAIPTQPTAPITPPAQPSAPAATPVAPPAQPSAPAPPVPPSGPTPETNFPTSLESTSYPTFHGYEKKKKPHYPYYPNYAYGKGKKSKGSEKGYYYYGKGKSKKSKSKSSSSSSGYKNGGSGGKGVNGGQFFHHKTPADGYYDYVSYPGKERAQELHVTRTGGGHQRGGHQREPVVSVFNWRREGGA